MNVSQTIYEIQIGEVSEPKDKAGNELPGGIGSDEETGIANAE